MNLDIAGTIEAVVRERFPDAGIEAVKINEETDFDGDPVYRVTVIFDNGAGRALDAHRTAGVTRHIRHKLLEKHADAFPILAFVSKADAASLEPEAA